MIADQVTVIVSYDAGGAEILSSYVKHTPGNYLFVLDGPAKTIFEKKLGTLDRQNLEECIAMSDAVLTGTGWSSNLEYDAISFARKAGKNTISFLDHWVNYEERFIRNGVAVYPNEIWVGDEPAKELAEQIFPMARITLVPNPYWIDIRSELSRFTAKEKETASILLVSEPIREHAAKEFGNERYWGYTEEDAIQYFFAHLHLFKDIDLVTVRPHPSEEITKYGWVKETYGHILPIEITKGKSLVEQIAKHSIIAGCESMALAVGILAGKRVISYIPPGGRECRLPFSEIEHLRRIDS